MLGLVLSQQVTGAWRIFQSSASLETSRTAPGDPGKMGERGVTFGQLDLGRILWGLQSRPLGVHLSPSAPAPEEGWVEQGQARLGASSSRTRCCCLVMEVTRRVQKRGGEGSL